MNDRIGLPPGLSPGLQQGLAGRQLENQQQQTSLLGNFRGETVKAQESPLSMLQNAAEELTFGAHERRPRRELGERRMERKEPSRQIEQAERIQEYLDNLPDFDRGKVDQLMERLLGQPQQPPSREQLGEALRGFHEDVTYQQAALELMDQALAGRTDPESQALRGGVQAQIAANARDLAPAIQAGLNVTPQATLAASDAREVQDLRNLYRETVLSHESLGKSWRNIVERYGEGDLGSKIKFLLKAIGDDLHSRGPSIAPAELKAILDETHQLETLSTIRERATGFLTRLHARFGAEAGA